MSDNINFNIIVWEKKNNFFICQTSNNPLGMNNILLNDYIKDHNVDYRDSYEKAISTKETQLINKDNFYVILQYIEDDIVIEMHIPSQNNLPLLSSVSHKIRNPLTSIIGVITLINETKLDKYQKKYMAMLKKSSYEIISVANDLIDILNLGKNQVKLNCEKVVFEKLLTECKNISIKEVSDKKIDLKIQINKGVPQIIITDGQRLKQMIINFLTNAINHTEIGGITLEVSPFEKKDHESSDCPFPYVEGKKPVYNLLFKVKDTGVGIQGEARQFVENILGLNKKINFNIPKHRGFGLMINKYICNLMGGNIWFKSEKDMGSIFYFDIMCDGIMLKN